MIGQLNGTVLQVNSQYVLLDVAGVGYEIHCSYACVRTLEIGRQATIVVHTDVKEDSIRLYGFEDFLEKQVFLQLTKVSGVGAKSASDLVSQIDKVDLLRAIGAGDTARLEKVKGVGKKTAARMVIELRDRVGQMVSERPQRMIEVETIVEPVQDSIEALVALGFSRRDAEKAVELAQQAGLPGNAGSSDLVKEALRYV